MTQLTQLNCPHCHQKIDIDEALEKKFAADYSKKMTQLEDELKRDYEKRLATSKQELVTSERIRLSEQFKKQFSDQAIQIAQQQKKLEEAEKNELDLRQKQRELQESRRRFELEKARQLDLEREQIREKAIKEVDEKHSLLLAQERKKNSDAQNQILELQRKLQQGSQQSQGEVMELELQEQLVREFPLDQISEVKKGQRGADVVQMVVDRQNRECGLILFESKNARWSQGWISTLKENQRVAKAQIGVLVVNQLPEKIKTFAYQDGVWITSRSLVVALTSALRHGLIRVASLKAASENKVDKAAELYEYVTSLEFKHRVEAIVETFSQMQESIEAEKRWFTAKWSKQEKLVRKAIDNTIGMRGEMEGLIGNLLPKVDYFQLPEKV